MHRFLITILILLGIICLSNTSYSQHTSYEQSENVVKAYNAVMSLRFDDARQTLEILAEEEPNNLLRHHVENYIDFLTVFINEDKKELEYLEKKNKSRRLDELKKGDNTSPYYRFSQAEVLLQWALARSKFYDDAFIVDRVLLNDINKAYRLLEANEREFPDFIENKKSLSVIHALAEYLPGAIKKLFKIRGSLNLGKSEIEEVVAYGKANDFLFLKEAEAIYAYMLLHLFNQADEAWDVVMDSELDPSHNPLAAFLLGSIGLKSGRTDEVIEILDSRASGPEYFPFHYVDFILGKGKLYKLDPSAKSHIETFLNKHKGRHFIKEAYQKRAWVSLAIENDMDNYATNMAACLEEGHNLLEDDQQAIREAKTEQRPQKELLQARLLYDGGYYQRAYDLLIAHKTTLSKSVDHHLEYSYRLGRLTHAMNNHLEARDYYEYSLAAGKKQNTFFACNSALQLGLIAEEEDQYDEAIKYFKATLDISPNIYKSQLHNKAKAGLNRIKKKT